MLSSGKSLLDRAEKSVFYNLSVEKLKEKALESPDVSLSSDKTLVVTTGKHTGRAAQDKYIVESSATKEKVSWGKDVRMMTRETYSKLKEKVVCFLNDSQDLYVSEKAVGDDSIYSVGLRLITTSAHHALFANYLFRETRQSFEDFVKSQRGFTIYHAPLFKADVKELGTHSETVIVTSFEEREVIIVGTLYAGEIKKSAFSIMNYLLPDEGILPMHAGASVNNKKEASLFFGLSGTGKTTLSTDIGTKLIGDDEHGLHHKGIFNFEGGCYAKTYKLSKESEPDIFAACTREGALLENVVLDKASGKVDFSDMSLAENARGSYPLDFIEHRELSMKGDIPKQIFFLSADAFAVLPPVSELTPEQAMYYFLSGYTAKLAGTEIGVKTPTAAFSTCFGAPFMVRHPQVYGKLLGEYIKKYSIKVWLINTGWYGGPFGERGSERFPLKVTRKIIRSIQEGKLNAVEKEKDPIFGLAVPKAVPGVEETLLNPSLSWGNKDDYRKQAEKLAEMFHKNFCHFPDMDKEILLGGPTFKQKS